MNKIFHEIKILNALITLLIMVVLFRAGNEFYGIAWGTGTWQGEFSRTWALLYYLFIAFCATFFVVSASFIWNNKFLRPFINHIILTRQRLGYLRWLLWFIVLVSPIWFFQYTAWGIVFQKLYLRILIWIITVCLLTVLASNREQLAGWNECLAALIITASAFSIAASLKYVTDYPFSLGWSEGNRLWDYSILFGRGLYIFPPDKEIPVFLDFGRKIIGGFPFLFPNITITMERFWVALMLILPYFLLGFVLFRAAAKDKILWFLLILWTFLFLKQGPIHAPLVLSAAMVALAWRAPLWYAIPLLIGAVYLTNVSRQTWILAPGIWIVMLEFSSTSLATFVNRKSVSLIWKRSIILGALGIFGAFVFPNLIQSMVASFTPPPISASTPTSTQDVQIPTPAVQATPVAAPATPDSPETPISKYIDYAIYAIKDQPLLWYRLLPNSTYDKGILLSLLLAIAPLLTILIYLASKNIWLLGRLQKLSLILPLLAFLVVGLVASTKIGGGGDLHNLDMFLVGLLFAGALAWGNGGRDWVQNDKAIPTGMKIIIVALLVNSSIGPLLEMRSYNFGKDASWLITLTDAQVGSTMDMLPTESEVQSALKTIQGAVDQAKLHGEVLFLDQRQLLTFGQIKGVSLAAEYEKKLLMNEALSGNSTYFDGFYADLAAQRFSLIISEPLRTPIKDSSYQFGEENNAWVEWVATPILCYYEPLETIKTVNVQILTPNMNARDCSSVLP